ncbi:FAD:protein FMN transferase [Amycolatopsis sp. WAC 04169]|uniref:FAD:protein FMN transferase n=1 Tax=Amycolatopsis sp. WAC 04169 TaxID=2203197 RepID=UPI0018F6853C|nr:FAD:protein FMN transferase [Amycolatopsis sp. WAC 04169]
MKRVEQVMGLPVSVDIRDEGDHLTSLARVFAWLHEVDERFSPFRTDSEVSRFDRGDLAVSELSDDLLDILMTCDHYEQLSGGAFTARLPGKPLDPNAITKGWAVQRAARLLKSAGLEVFCVNAGGDVVTAGEPEPGRGWRIGIRHPEQRGEICAVVESADGAVATSACYERGSHIFNGRTGRPAEGLLSVTIVAEDLLRADALATAAFAMGVDGIAWAASQPGCRVLIVDADRQVHRSSDLKLL